MLQLLNIYPDIDVKKSALTVAKRHLWYLSERNVGLAFLDERISQIEKTNMTKHLEPQLPNETIRCDSLISQVDALKVVNDTAERGIAVIKKFNEWVRDEKQKQFLLRVIEHHRKVITKRTKQRITSFKVE
ncbi:unnamed protein product [Psylliodes chrysocephalus]|uniref:Uncharacterized protein n=1 Tax=Psylliodes chrysocephalus TaxID=3402493 RepID=A0A9P0CKC1_9CUCU|nr:unnamed protein product [Psylliodes chrysocephala]